MQQQTQEPINFNVNYHGGIIASIGVRQYDTKEKTVMARERVGHPPTALAHEQGHTSDMVAAIVPIFQGAEHHYGSQEECEAAAEEAALRAGPAWESAAANSQRRRH